MVEVLKDWASFGGRQKVFRHMSQSTGTAMDVAVYFPPQALDASGAVNNGAKLPVLFFLSGLTCNWENFTTKAGAQNYAARHGLILVMPDTSPRGNGAGTDENGVTVPNDAAYDLGQGAGFYVNATQAPWAQHFRMWDYVTEELPALMAEIAPMADLTRLGVAGHSMGGHGALVAALRRPDLFKSVSALSPIVAPSQCPWGEKAFNAYLGADKTSWAEYDATQLLQQHKPASTIMIDQGLADEFLETQLKTPLFEQACKQHGVALKLRMLEGYDHSYYFIASVIEDHIAHHASIL